MKSSYGKQFKYALHIIVADIPCELIFSDNLTYTYFKTRFYTNPVLSNSVVSIDIHENGNQFVFTTLPENVNCSINKSYITSLEDVFFILTALLQINLLKFQVLFLHASSCRVNKKAYIFLAPSGSGKSTIINTIPPKDVLSDDIAIVKKLNQDFHVYTSPFDNKMQKKLLFQHERLEKIFFIKQASFTKFVELDKSETVNELLQGNIFFWWIQLQKNKEITSNKKVISLFYKLIIDIIAFSKAEILYFKKDMEFLSSI